MDELEKMFTRYRAEKARMCHNIIAEMKLIDTDRPNRKYLEFMNKRYVFEDGRYVGWYNPEGAET